MTQQAMLFGSPAPDQGYANLKTMSRNHWIREARYAAAQIAMQRGTVTTDDVQAVHPLPVHLDVNTWGSVLKPPFFRKVDTKQTRRWEGRGRLIHVWALNNKDTSWMRAIEAAT
jgi:hypothetical protein